MTDLSVEKLCTLVEADFVSVESEERKDFFAASRVERFERTSAKDFLFDYQYDLVKQVSKLCDSGNSALLSLPTGGGKTRTAVASVLEFLEGKKSAKVAWLAPTNELLDQAHDTFSRLWNFGLGPKTFGVNRSGIQNSDCYVWLATPQAVNQKVVKEFDFVVFDEAHQMQARTYSQAVSRIRRIGAPLLGLSATPGRSKDAEISELVELFGGNLLVSKILGAKPVETLRERGILSVISYSQISNAPTSLTRFRDSVHLIKKLMEEKRKVLFFGRNLEEAEAMQKLMQFYGHESWYVDGNTPDIDRRSRIEAFAGCNSGLLTNQKLLTTGYDCPAVTDVVLGSKVGSSILFEQMVGRASRGKLVGGSESSRVWQFDDHIKLHGEPQAHIRFAEGHWGIS